MTDRQCNTPCHLPKRLLIHLPARCLPHTHAITLSFSECQLIFLPCSVQAAPPFTRLLRRRRRLPPSARCAVASVVKVMAWQTALWGDACLPCVLWRRYCEEGIKHLPSSLAGQRIQSVVRCRWMTWRKSKCSRCMAPFLQPCVIWCLTQDTGSLVVWLRRFLVIASFC